jgi:hypothetical protein
MLNEIEKPKLKQLIEKNQNKKTPQIPKIPLDFNQKRVIIQSKYV